MNKPKRRKLHFGPFAIKRLVLILVGTLVLTTFIFAITLFQIANRIIGQYIDDAGNMSLYAFQETLDHNLAKITQFCENNLSDNAVTYAYNAQCDESVVYELRKSIHDSMQQLMQIHSSVRLVIYEPTKIPPDRIIRQSSLSSLKVTDSVEQLLLGTDRYQNTWRWATVEGENYLCKSIGLSDGICTVVLDSSILTELSGVMTDFEFTCEQDGEYLSDNPAIQKAKKSSETQSFLFQGNQHVLLSCPSSQGDFNVCCLVSTEEIGMQKNFRNVYLTLSGILLLLSPIVFLIIKNIAACFTTLDTACRQFGAGKLDTRIMQQTNLTEAAHIFGTFNKMAEQIKALKISLYEHKLAEQRSKMVLLRTQVKSHFFLNCLNTIHSLAVVGDTPLIQEFSLCLSDYFRYLGSGFSDTVRFSSELVHLQNYIKLNQIRYPDRIRCTFSIDPQVETQQILPMLPQTFVENIFKHALGSSNVINIHIQAYSAEIQGGMYLIIQDDGPGFSTEMLQQLNDPSRDTQIPASTGPGTGIQNSKARMGLFYGGRASVRFENAQDHGAIVRLYFPNPK